MSSKHAPLLDHSRAAWSAAILLAVAWHALGFVCLKPVFPTPRARRPFAPVLTYLPLSKAPAGKDGEAGELHTLWSPLLFSLPSPLGFSRPLLKEDMSVRPPVESPNRAQVLLERKPALAPQPAVDLSLFAGKPEQRLQSWPSPVSGEPVAPRPATPPPHQWLINYRQGFAPGDFVSEDLSEIHPTNAEPWEAAAAIETDKRGVVRSVLLEEPAPQPALNAALARALYHWRLKRPGGVRSGRLLIHWTGAETAPGPAAAAPNNRDRN